MENYGGLMLATAIFLMAGAAQGQIDPELRELIQGGISQAVQGASPLAGYGYYYLNEPNFARTNVTLRLAVAPVYLDSELGFTGLLGPHTDLAVGLAGGGFADNYYEFDGGKYQPRQSFVGYGAEGSVSLYHLFNPDQRIPLNGVLRLTEHYSMYGRTDELASGYRLPPDHSSFNWRAGLRFGGREPLFTPAVAMELSAWAEGQFRPENGSYGFDGDRQLNAVSDLFWARALLIYTFPNSNSMEIGFTAGTSDDADRFSAYRLGGLLPLASEFPLSIPGYFYQELSARNFVAINANYSIPLTADQTWRITPLGGLALVDYLPGTGQSGAFNSGIGLGVGYRARSRHWQALATFGYGFEAERSHGRGAEAVGILFEMNLRGKNSGEPTRLDRAFGFLSGFF
ncbi:MAG TPA: hypothetical protein VGO59_06440 [Verrucomicrobiae bacterium]|jgi:hypothetical protein